MALRCETGMLGIKWRVWEEKISLLMRRKNHSEDTLCRQIYEEGKSKGWPGLYQEVKEICEIINIPDVNEVCVPKAVIKRAVFEHHQQEMKAEVMSKKKLDQIKNDDFSQVQDYFKNKSIENARMSFKLRCQMLENILGNFKNKYKKLKCQHCSLGEVMTQSHCLECNAWG